jgi:hypothetical protein
LIYNGFLGVRCFDTVALITKTHGLLVFGWYTKKIFAKSGLYSIGYASSSGALLGTIWLIAQIHPGSV